MKLLIIEDDKNILESLKCGFEDEGYVVDMAVDGEEGIYQANTNSYDVIVLDWMMPKFDGIEVLEVLRKDGVKTPIIMLTAKANVKDRVKGLSVGADDYLSKPFHFEELFARVEALYRRAYLSHEQSMRVGDITIKTDIKKVYLDEKELILSAKEYELLLFLIKNKNSYVSKFMLSNQLWSDEEFTKSNVVEATIYNLRKKIGKDLIKTFKGLGYKIEI